MKTDLPTESNTELSDSLVQERSKTTVKKYKLPPKEKLSMVSNLSTMLVAGIPISEAVDSLQQDSKSYAKKVLGVMKRSLQNGRSVSYAMSLLPRVFDKITVNLIKASEEAGTLDQALKDLVAKIKRDMEFSSNIRSSLMYPAFVIGIFLAVLGLILVFVIPRIARVFAGLNIELPLATELLIKVSDILLRYYPLILVVSAVSAVALVVIYKAYKRLLVNFLMNMPGFKSLGINIDLARFTRSMHLMLNAGIPVAEALALAKESVNKKSIVKAINMMEKSVLEGRAMSTGLDGHNSAVPPLMVKMIQTAERSGTLETMMQELADYFETEVARSLKTITTLIEPIMIVVVGVLVGGMMLAVIAPMYDLITQIRGR